MFLQEALYALCVFLGVELVATSMFGMRGKPDFFVANVFGTIERVYHPSGYKFVGCAMNKEHRLLATAHLIECRCFFEIPSIAPLA